MMTNELRNDLEELGFAPDEIDRLEKGYGAVVLQEAWMRLDMREMAGEIDEPQKYFLGICANLRSEGYTGTGAARTQAKLDPYAEPKHVPAEERLRRVYHSKLIETITDEMDPHTIRKNRDVLESIKVEAIDDDNIVIYAPNKYHRRLYELFGPYCQGRQMDFVDLVTGAGSTYHTDSIRLPANLSRAEIKEMAGTSDVAILAFVMTGHDAVCIRHHRGR